MLGGYTSSSSNASWLKSFIVLDGNSGEWRQLPDMKHVRSDFRMANVADRILVVGGIISEHPTDIVEMFNITSNSWCQTCSLLPSPMTGFALARVEAQYLDDEIVDNYMKFKSDVLLEKVKRVMQPISEYFQ